MLLNKFNKVLIKSHALFHLPGTNVAVCCPFFLWKLRCRLLSSFSITKVTFHPFFQGKLPIFNPSSLSFFSSSSSVDKKMFFPLQPVTKKLPLLCFFVLSVLGNVKSHLSDRQNDNRGEQVTLSLTLFVPILPSPVSLAIWLFFIGVVTPTGSDVTCFSTLLHVADSVSDVESLLF